MKNVLIVTYYFPPSGGPGVQRVLKFSTYLLRHGWRPIILTVENGDYPARDESLLAEIPPEAVVIRTPIFEPYDLYRRLTGKAAGTAVDVNVIPKPGERRSLQERAAEFIRATFFIPDARRGWLRHAVPAGMRAIREHDIQAIYSSSPPYTCALIARALQRRSGLPWIAGFRDPWTGFLSAPKRWWLPAAIDRHYERAVFAGCDRMEVAWTGILKDFHGKYPGVPTTKVHHLPNGFDSADFPALPPSRSGRFTVTYTGSMYGKRNPAVFLEAVRLLAARGDVDPARLCLQFIGRFGAEVRTMLDGARLGDAVVVRDYMPHADSVRALFASDALLMVVDDHEGNEEIVPGKVYEYIGSERPIIALAPLGAVTAVIEETGAGRHARSHDVEAVAAIVGEFYRQWSAGTLGAMLNRDVVRQYERSAVAGHLAALLDEVVAERAARRG
jgi:glycosyltransferase involved in cell wall biosynthesis